MPCTRDDTLSRWQRFCSRVESPFPMSRMWRLRRKARKGHHTCQGSAYRIVIVASEGQGARAGKVTRSFLLLSRQRDVLIMFVGQDGRSPDSLTDIVPYYVITFIITVVQLVQREVQNVRSVAQHVHFPWCKMYSLA